MLFSIQVTIIGDDFGNCTFVNCVLPWEATLFFGQLSIHPVLEVDHTTISFNLPEGMGSNITVKLQVGGQTSPDFYFSYDKPMITKVKFFFFSSFWILNCPFKKKIQVKLREIF